MKPSDLGLPSKFAAYRPRQFETAVRLHASRERFVSLCAGTGTGKTATYATAIALLRAAHPSARALVLVGTKALQDQICADFPDWLDIRGKANYTCRQYGGNVDVAPCQERTDHGCPLRSHGCSYYDLRAAACAAPVVVSNYATRIATARYATRGGSALGHFDLVVCDEAHTLLDWLSQSVEVRLSVKLNATLGLPPMPTSPDIESLASWAASALPPLRDAFRADPTNRVCLDYGMQLRNLATATLPEWVVTEITRHRVVASPVWPSSWAERYVFQGAAKIVLASATLPQRSLPYVGVDVAERVSVASPFPVSRRPVYYIPGDRPIRVDYRTSISDRAEIVRRIDEFLAPRLALGWKGIVHSQSYEYAKFIAERSTLRDRMITHDSRSTLRAVNRYLAATDARLIVSPVLYEGWDFPHDAARVQAIFKLPFVSSKDPLTQRRKKSYSDYTNDLAGQRLTQMFGRPIRDYTDYGETGIFDAHWVWFRHRHPFDPWVSAAFVNCVSAPPPLVLT